MKRVFDVTVVIPMRNSEGTIGRALRSLDNQIVMPKRVIVVDNDSEDDSLGAASRTSLGIPVDIVSCPILGAGAARNVGMALVDTEYVGFLDADDIWYKEKLLEQSRDLGAGQEFCGTFMDYLSKGGRRMGDSTNLICGESPSEALRTASAMPVPISSVVMRRELAVAAGEFDETFIRAQDMEWLVRVAQLADLHVSGATPLVGYTLSGGSASASSYFEQYYAAELVRSRRSGNRSVDYSSGVTKKVQEGGFPRELVSAYFYRQAGAAVADGRYCTGAYSLVRAVLSDPAGVFEKMRRQRVIVSWRHKGVPAAARR